MAGGERDVTFNYVHSSMMTLEFCPDGGYEWTVYSRRNRSPGAIRQTKPITKAHPSQENPKMKKKKDLQ
jgi:hypothetical protein